MRLCGVCVESARCAAMRLCGCGYPSVREVTFPIKVVRPQKPLHVKQLTVADSIPGISMHATCLQIYILTSKNTFKKQWSLKLMCLQHSWLTTALSSPCNQIGINSAKSLQRKENDDGSTDENYNCKSIHTVRHRSRWRKNKIAKTFIISGYYWQLITREILILEGVYSPCWDNFLANMSIQWLVHVATPIEGTQMYLS